MKRLILAAACLLLAAPLAHAQLPAPAQPIQALDDALLQVMHEGKATAFAERYNQLVPVVQQTFDLPAILQTSIGPKWQSFSPDQQQQLLAEFVRFTVASYLSNFSSFNGEKFEVDPTLRAVGSEQVVSSHIIPASGTPARIDYVMRQGTGGWQAVDVLLDGSISRVAVQRSDFRTLADAGPQALLDSLTKKVTDLSGGATVP